MRKALVNYWVDMVTGVAFLLCAVTGIVFLFPGTVHTAAGAAPTILLIPATWWHTVHDWTGVAMVAGTALHLALHAKWIATMTRRTLGAPAETGPARSARPAPVAGPRRQPAAGAAVVAASAHSPLSAADDAAASLERLEALRDTRRREHEQRLSRRRFLAGAALVGGAALVAGVGLVGRDSVSDASTRLNDDGWTDGGGSASDGSGSGATGSASGSSASSAQSAASGGAGTTQVVVDQSACIACGRCLEVCPAGVFDWSASGRAEAVDSAACIRCGRCLQACPAGAITVSA